MTYHPGTGKTLLAKAVATECGLPFLSVKGPELLDMYIGESEKRVRELFATAKSAKPCVLFFDELDSLAPARGRGSDSGGVMDRVVSQLLTEIDTDIGGDVIVIAATNRPDLLDPSLLRPGRFDRMIFLGVKSTPADKLKVLEACMRHMNLAVDVDLSLVASQMPTCFTGADISAIASHALGLAVKRHITEIEAMVNAQNQLAPDPITSQQLLRRYAQEDPNQLRTEVSMSEIQAALSMITPSVSSGELRHYDDLRRRFSSSSS